MIIFSNHTLNIKTSTIKNIHHVINAHDDEKLQNLQLYKKNLLSNSWYRTITTTKIDQTAQTSFKQPPATNPIILHRTFLNK